METVINGGMQVVATPDSESPTATMERGYYVTNYDRSSGRIQIGLGPFRELAHAKKWVDPLREAAVKNDPWMHFKAFGVCGAPQHSPGPANKHLGLELDEDGFVIDKDGGT